MFDGIIEKGGGLIAAMKMLCEVDQSCLYEYATEEEKRPQRFYAYVLCCAANRISELSAAMEARQE